MTKKDLVFVWSIKCEWIFQELKQILITVLVLALLKQHKPLVVVYNDTSKLGLDCVLMMQDVLWTSFGVCMTKIEGPQEELSHS